MPDREVKHSKTGRTNVRLPPTGTLLWPRWGRSASHRLNALELRSFSSARTRSVALNRTRMNVSCATSSRRLAPKSSAPVPRPIRCLAQSGASLPPRTSSVGLPSPRSAPALVRRRTEKIRGASFFLQHGARPPDVYEQTSTEVPMRPYPLRRDIRSNTAAPAASGRHDPSPEANAGIQMTSWTV